MVDEIQDIEQILQRLRELEAQVAAQQETINAQQKKIDAQKREIERLESVLAAAKKNSSNSSKPPSSDIVNPKKKDKNSDTNSTEKRKQGGQKGHPAHFREDFPPEQVDKIFFHTLTICPACGHTLEDADRAPAVVQQITIIEKPIRIEEHRGMPYWCPMCQCFHYAPLPPEVEYGGLFDVKLTCIVAHMKSVCHASFSTIRKFVRDILGVTVSRSYLKKIVGKVSDALAGPYGELEKALPFQCIINIDESTVPENGKNLWLWIFETKLFSLYKIDPSRGSKVLIEMLGEDFQGVIGCDYFSAYRKYMRKFNVVVQFCLAHLIRDIKYLTGLKDQPTQAYGERLREQMRSLFALIHSRDEYKPEVFEALLLACKAEIIDAATKNVPESREARNLAKRFEKHGEYFFTFITTPDLDPTNNVAEQAIRFVTIDRLVTQGVRGEWGRRAMERLWSIIRTCEKQGRHVLTTLEEMVLSFWLGTPPPSLLPNE